ncbi:hypothetical protein [Paenibacillus alvei]|uniref:hypothetical protein n=1 Tax=Paenibacillus alvei TaxID=44250 RepID=UPI0013D998A2|nr:hypothetical protein [Paenibacillus alvei]NEZ44421.1 hypothetical protein [Paenibacillus alvei]
MNSKINEFSNCNRMISERENAYDVLAKLQAQIRRAEDGKIKFSQVFNAIDYRQCLPEFTIVPTSWRIDDIRDRFPSDTTDEVLYEALEGIERHLESASIYIGWEVISDNIGDDLI